MAERATGNEERFGELYDAHRAALIAYCRRRVPGDVVDDVMAEVFVAAWRRVEGIPVVLGISAAAVDMRLSRAKRRFERALNAAGFTRRPRASDRLAVEGPS